MIPKVYLYAIVASLIIGGSFAAGVRWEKGTEAIAEQRLQVAEQRMTDAAAKAIASIKITNRTIQAETVREIQTNTVYADCKLPPSGMQLANQALSEPGADSR